MDYYDDNFGRYDIESEEDIEFYHRNQRESVLKTCSMCSEEVMLLPHYDKCDSCCRLIESGMAP